MQKMELVELRMNGRVVRTWVKPEVKAYFNEQFVRGNPSVFQKKRYVTIMNLMRAAYEVGRQDAFRRD